VSSKSDTGSGDVSWFICRPSRVAEVLPGPHRAVAGLRVIEVIAIPPEGRHDCPVATRWFFSAENYRDRRRNSLPHGKSRFWLSRQTAARLTSGSPFSQYITRLSWS
jgi:hypothetical protein